MPDTKQYIVMIFFTVIFGVKSQDIFLGGKKCLGGRRRIGLWVLVIVFLDLNNYIGQFIL